MSPITEPRARVPVNDDGFLVAIVLVDRLGSRRVLLRRRGVAGLLG